MKQKPNINFRQKELLKLLMSDSGPITLQELAESLKVSVRTVQRELNVLESIIRNYHLETHKKSGIGIQILGSSNDRLNLQRDLAESETEIIYSPEERQKGLICDLLLTNEPVKLYTFSRKYGVTEATISHDLDRVEEWFRNFGISVARKPGLGTYLAGEEQQIRVAAAHLLNDDVTIEEWIELFNLSNVLGDMISKDYLRGIIRDRLIQFVDVSNILALERIIREAIQSKVQFSDREYVNLIIHLALSIERFKNGDLIEPNDHVAFHFENMKEYSLAQKIANYIECQWGIPLPPYEIGYIAHHLQGARSKSHPFIEPSQETFQWMDAAKSFVRKVESILSENLLNDEILIEGLITHLSSTSKNLKFGLTTNNPLLNQMVEKYPELYTACKEAAGNLSTKVGYPFPSSEIGYLVMHIAGALIRKKNGAKHQYSVIVVCASGFGTSQYLSSGLRRELPNIEVKAIVSVIGIKEWLESHPPVDFIISTIALPQLSTDMVVNVTPILRKGDLDAIQNMMENVSLRRNKSKGGGDQITTMIIIAQYGEGLVQILRNFLLIDDIRPNAVQLSNLVERIKNSEAVFDHGMLLDDLEKREEMGSFILDDLAMIHTKSSGVKELFVTVFRFAFPVDWREADGSVHHVRTFLLLAAPAAVPKPHLQMMGLISAGLIDESFLEKLKTAPFDSLKKELETILSNGYQEKMDQILKEV
jgi:mannitol operon transcriptional antiterminator